MGKFCGENAALISNLAEQPSAGSDSGVRNGSRPVAVFKRHCSSFPWNDICCLSALFLLLHLWLACDTFHQGRSTDIWNFALSHSKKSIQVSGDSPVCPLVTAGAQSGVSWPSSPSALRQDYLRSLEPTAGVQLASRVRFHSATAPWLNKIGYNWVFVWGKMRMVKS